MLKIQNIERIVGMLANGRYIAAAGNYGDTGNISSKEKFVFVIQDQNDGKEYDKQHYIVLEKNIAQNGKYYMFNMGLERVTGIHVPKYHMRNPADFAVYIKKVLVKTEDYYQTK